MCLSCAEGKYIPNGTTPNTCNSCSYKCSTCSNSDTSCNLCAASTPARGSTPSCDCPSEHYYDLLNDSDCKDCHSNCLTCSSNTASSCLSCDPGKFIPNDSTPNTCNTCSYRCSTCNNTKDNCTACASSSTISRLVKPGCGCPV